MSKNRYNVMRDIMRKDAPIMKKVLAWLLVLALTAAISIGATLAYLTDTDEDVNVMTLGKVKIDQLEYERIDDETANEKAEVQEFHDNKPLLPAVTDKNFDYTPGDTEVDWTQIGKDGYTTEIWDPSKINNEVDKMVFVKNKGNYDAFVRTIFAFEAGNYETLDQFRSMVHLNLNQKDFDWTWVELPVEIPNAEGGTTKYFVATATYKDILKPGALTEISLSQIALDKTATNADVEAFGDTYQILVKSQAIQADGFENPVAALNDGFEVISENNVPWVSDTPVAGATVSNAIHYLNGDVNGTQITANVKSLTYGLTENYLEIAEQYDAVLVDVEQDVPVYAYYVPSSKTRAAATYDVYLLANDEIYTPANSKDLLRGMTGLTSLNLENLNTSRTHTFAYFLRDCSNLTSVDVSSLDFSSIGVTNDLYGFFYGCSKLTTITGLDQWDVSKAVDMTNLFRNCSSLKSLDLSGWNTGNVTSMSYMFRDCTALTTADLSGWDTSNVVNATQLAARAGNLVSLDTTGWTFGKLENSSHMFFQCGKLTEVIGSGTWNLDKVTNAYSMFEYAYKLASLDVTNWGLSSLTDGRFMFDQCNSLKTLTGEENWTLDSLDNAQQMFNACHALTALDSEGWGMGKAQNMYLAFGTCKNLEYIQTGSWNTGSMVDLTGTFQHCYKLTTIDVSNWNTSNVTSMWGTFNASTNLEELDVSKWDVSKVTKFTMMFQGNGSNAGDMKIKKLDVSNWKPVSAVEMGHMFYGCAQLTELDLSGWVMPKLYTTSHMFADCYKLETIDVSGWQTTGSWYSMDAMFNDCRVVKTLDVSSWNTSGVVEMSQVFESCYSLKQIKGIENWNTSSSKCFDQTFLNCNSLKELNLSGWNTHNAQYGNKHLNGDISEGFSSTFSGVISLTKLTLGEHFDFDGNGTATKLAVLPNPAAKEGFTAKWRNVETGQIYLASEIPDGVAATYEAYYEDNAKG